jgi:hypothetical protein
MPGGHRDHGARALLLLTSFARLAWESPRMRQSTRVALIVLFVATVVATGLLWDRPEGTEAPTMSVPVDPDYDAQLAEIADRTATKTALVADLIAGRAELVAVAARFEALDAGRFRGYYAQLPGATSGERRCRAVLDLVRAARNGDARQRSVLVRLEADLATFIAAGNLLPLVPGPHWPRLEVNQLRDERLDVPAR